MPIGDFEWSVVARRARLIGRFRATADEMRSGWTPEREPTIEDLDGAIERLYAAGM